MQGTEQINCNGAGGGFPFFGGQVLAQLTDPGLAIFLGNVPAQKDELAGLDKGYIGCRWYSNRW